MGFILKLHKKTELLFYNLHGVVVGFGGNKRKIESLILSQHCGFQENERRMDELFVITWLS